MEIMDALVPSIFGKLSLTNNTGRALCKAHTLPVKTVYFSFFFEKISVGYKCREFDVRFPFTQS